MAKSFDQFAAELSGSGLLSSDEVASFIGRLSATERAGDAQALARELVKAGKLTKFQAAAVYQGKTKGLVFGEYVVLDKIGAGGMGQVFKAQHRRMKRTVAIKLMSLGSSRNADAVKRFYQEVEMAARLNHPNIVTAYDAGEAEGLHFLVMEFVDGRDLMSVLKEHGTLPVDQVVSYIQQAAEGLAYAHAQGVIHRDIKPANLLLDKQGRVKILDMGLARLDSSLVGGQAAADGLTQSGQILGTVDYMAPEQAADTHTADHRADIYSLGCTLYRLLTGQPPFGGESVVQKIFNHRDQPIPSLVAARPDAPPRLDLVLQRMLAKRPDDRYQTTSELIVELKSLESVGTDHSASVLIPHEAGSDPSYESFLRSTPVSGVSLLQKAKVIVSPRQQPTDDTLRPIAVDSDTDANSGESNLHLRRKPPLLLISAGGAALLMMLVVLGVWLGPQSSRPRPESVADAPEVGKFNEGWAPSSRNDTATTAPPATTPPTPDSTATVPGATPAVPPGADPSATAPATTNPSNGDSSTDDGVPFMALPAPFDSANQPPPPAAPPPDPAAQAPPVANEAPITDKVDLIASIDLNRDTVEGQFQKDGSSLLILPGSISLLELPAALPPEYTLFATYEPRSPSANRFNVGLVVGGNHVVASLGHDWSALSHVDGQPGSGNSTTNRWTGLRSLSLKQATYYVRPNEVLVTVDDTPVIRWTGDPATLSLNTTRRPRRSNRLFLAADANIGDFRVTRLEVVPGVAEWPEATSPIDLLARTDPAEAAVTGSWQRQGLAWVGPAEDRGDRPRLQIPVSVAPPYRIDLVVQRLEGSGPLFLSLPGPAGRILVTFDWELMSTLGNIDGRERDNASSYRGIVAPPGRLTHLSVVVDRQRIRVYRGGQSLIDWSDLSRLQPSSNGWDGDEPGKPCLGAMASRFRIDCAVLTPLAGAPTDATDPWMSAPWWPQSDVPGAEEFAAASADIAALLRSGSSSDTAARRASSQSLLRQAQGTGISNVRRYALLQAALQSAARGADLPTLMAAIDELSRNYRVSVPELTDAASSELLEAVKLPADRKAMTFEALRLADVRTALGDFTLASGLLSLADALLKKTRDLDLVAEWKPRTVEVTEYLALADKARGAQQRLAANPDDSSAHEDLAWYLALARGNWAAGMQHLAHAESANLRNLARLELSNPASTAAQTELGDAWWDLVDRNTPKARELALQQRAMDWYERALAEAPLNVRRRIEARSKQMDGNRKALSGAFTPRHPLDATRVGDKWYTLVKLRVDWHAAVLACQAMGGQLAVLQNPKDNDDLLRWLDRQMPGDTNLVWLGATDEKREGAWQWVDGTPMTFAAWAPGQPDNLGGNEHYLYAYRGGPGGVFIWADTSINNQGYFVCQWIR